MPGPTAFLEEFFQTFKFKIISVLLKRLQITAMEGKLKKLFYDMTIAVFSKPGKSCINTNPQTTEAKIWRKQ